MHALKMVMTLFPPPHTHTRARARARHEIKLRECVGQDGSGMKGSVRQTVGEQYPSAAVC
jgi:hypothetical protein